VEAHLVREPGEEALPELALLGHDPLPAERLEIADGGDEPGERLVRERARLEARSEGLVGRRPHLVRPPALQHLTAPEEEPEVRPAELVRRAEEDVHAGRAHVDRPVRRVVDRVRPGEGAGSMRELGDAPGVGDRSDRVRSPWKGDHARPSRELPLQVCQVESRVLFLQVGEADDEVEVARELEPG
jgi:hypothetical protein